MILNNIDLIEYNYDLKDGDIILMCSDGILDSNKEYINKELVYNSWKSTGQSQFKLQEKWYYVIDPQTGKEVKKPNLAYKITDIIGFAPNNAFDNGFDYKTY